MTWTADEHEAGLVLFLVGSARSSFRSRLSATAGSRLKLRRGLAHFERRLDPRFATRVRHTLERPVHVALHAELVAAGAPADAHLFSDERAGATTLTAGLEALFPHGSGLLSCLPGRLAAYVGEDGTQVFLLRRD